MGQKGLKVKNYGVKQNKFFVYVAAQAYHLISQEVGKVKN